MLALILAAPLAFGNAPALDYPGGAFAASVVDNGAEKTVTFPSPVKSRFAPNNTVWGHLLLPAGPGPHPCILVLPVMAAPNIWIERRFINKFVAEGFAVLWLEMPYQFHRRPDPSMPSGQVFLARTAKGLAANFRQSALDARRALSWLSERPEVDAKRIGIFGISLGAMVGSAVYSVDRTPKHAVFLLGGADFPGLAGASSMTGSFVRKAGITQESLRQSWRGIDPLDYRAQNADKKALLINASWDTVIPKANALKLKEAFASSRQEWVWFGHYTAILHLFWIPGRVAREFRKNL